MEVIFMRTVGLLVSVLGMLMAVCVASDYNFYGMRVLIDWPTIAFFVFALAGAVIGTGSGKTFISGVNGVLSRKYQMTDEQRGKAVGLFKLLGNVTTSATVAITFIGIIMLLTMLNDPSAIGTYYGMVMVAVFWGAVIHMLFIQPSIYLLNQSREPEPARAARVKDKQALEKLAQLCFEKGLTYEDIMEADEIQLL
jgi:uncharacterized membrane protein